MAHAMKLKSGRIITVLGPQDVLEALEEYAGQEPRRYIEEYLEDVECDKVDFDVQEKDYENRLERQDDHYRSVLNDVREAAEELDALLNGERLNRKKLQATAKCIWKLCYQEL